MKAEMVAWLRDAKGRWLRAEAAQEYAMRQLIDVHGMILFTQSGPGIPTIEVLRLKAEHYTRLPEKFGIRNIHGGWSYTGDSRNTLEADEFGWLVWGIERHHWVQVLGILRGAG
jgi:hypothetical protein